MLIGVEVSVNRSGRNMIPLLHKFCRIMFVAQILSTVIATWESTIVTGLAALIIAGALVVSLDIIKRC